MPSNTPTALVILGGIAFLIALIGGGVKIGPVELPKLSSWIRGIAAASGLLAIVLGVVIYPDAKWPLPPNDTTVPTVAAPTEIVPNATFTTAPTVEPTPAPSATADPASPPAEPTSSITPTEPPTPTVQPTDSPTPTPTSDGVASTPCDLGTAYTSPPLWLPTVQGEVRTFLHCPPTNMIQYEKIAVDDELAKVEKVCAQGTTDITSLFEAFTLETDALIHYRSQPFQLEAGCAVAFTVRDVQGENIGLYIRQAHPIQCAFLTQDQVNQLYSFQKVEDAIHEAEKMAGYRQNDYDPGDTIPASVLIATNLLTSDLEQFGVTPVNSLGGYGLFLTTREFTAPNDGTYWCIR